jgi:hypothetical protein
MIKRACHGSKSFTYLWKSKAFRDVFIFRLVGCWHIICHPGSLLGKENDCMFDATPPAGLTEQIGVLYSSPQSHTTTRLPNELVDKKVLILLKSRKEGSKQNEVRSSDGWT